MRTSARYLGDGIRQCWLIPFPYGSAKDFQVTIEQDGIESELEHEKDFRVIEHCVIYKLAKDCQLAITLIAPLARVHALQEERLQAGCQALQSEARAAWHAEAAARIAEDASAEIHKDIEGFAESLARRFQAMKAEYETRAAELEKELQALREDAQAVTQATVTGAIEAMRIEAQAQLARGQNAGISAVKSLEELTEYKQGFFVINPWLYISQPYQGIWPKESLAAIKHDGFFVIIPDCPGHELNGMTGLPGINDNAKPENPGQNPGQNLDDLISAAPGSFGSYLWWLACHHSHNGVKDA